MNIKLILFRVLLIPLPLIIYFCSAYTIQKASGYQMEPSVKNGDTLIIQRPWSYLGTLYNGMVVSYTDNQGTSQIGRIIATPNSQVGIFSNRLYVKLSEEQILFNQTTLGLNPQFNGLPQESWISIGEDSYFIIKDFPSAAINIPDQIVPRNKIQGVVLSK